MIDTLLIDIDGTIVEKGKAVPGAAAAIETLRHAGLKLRFLTNISSRPPESLAAELVDAGFEGMSARDIRTAATAAVQILTAEGASFTDLLVPPAIDHLFGGLTLDREAPDYVVVGDVGEGFSYANMNAAFRLLHDGARILALQKNPHWLSADGPMIDSGAFVAGLEAATGQTAVLSGKPSPEFFGGALAELGSTAAATLVVGDDQTTDVAGALAIGAGAVMVHTGKGRHVDPELAEPRYVIDSLADLPALLDAIRKGG